MSDQNFNHDDFVDASEMVGPDEELDENEDEEDVSKKTRGKDIEWLDYEMFQGPDEYKQSNLRKELKEMMMRKKKWTNKESRNENFICKYHSKKGWKQCPRQYRVCFSNSSMNIAVFSTAEEHSHHEDPDYSTKENYHWTAKQEAIINRGIKNNIKNSMILRELKEEGAVNGSGNYPTLSQVGVKKRYVKNVKGREYFILDVNALKNYCKIKSVVPEDENEAYISFYYIDGSSNDDLIMTIIWTTTKLISRMDRKLLQDDATYKLNWYQYPMFVSSRSSPTCRFFLTHIALSSHEDTAAWVRIQAWIKSILGSDPR